jgi:hypothetical protein
LARPVTASNFYGATDVVRETLPIQPRRNRYVLRLYKCIGAQRLASENRKFCGPWRKLRHRHRPFTLASVSSQEPLQLGRRWRGKGGRRE